MRAGSEIKITVQDANKKPVEMGLPLLASVLPSTRRSRLLRLPD